jgi:ATP-dependent helicase/DNAse subunit B
VLGAPRGTRTVGRMRHPPWVPLTLVTGPANSAKARAVLDGVRTALERDPLLVVPTGQDVERYRRELAEDGLVVGARVLTFDGLLREAAARAATTVRPLGDLARERVAGAVVARTQLRVLASSAATPGFVRAATRWFAELQVARVDPPRLTAGLRAWAGEDAGRAAYAADVAALYRGYRAALERLRRPDRESWALGALDALRRMPRTWGATPVFFYGFDDLTPLQREAVDALAVGVDAEVWVSLTFEPGRFAFEGRARTVNDLAPLASRRVAMEAVDDYYAPASRAALHALERRLFEDVDVDAAPVAPGDAVVVLAAGGERAEAELVAAQALSLLRDGVPAQEVAIVVRSLEEAGPLLERVLEGFGVPVALRRRVPLGHLPLGHALIGLLRCATADATAGDLLDYLRGPGVLREAAAVDRLEREVRRLGAVTAQDALELWPGDEPYALGRLRRGAQRGAATLCEALAGELEWMARAALRRAALGPDAVTHGAPDAPDDDAGRALDAARPFDDAASRAGGDDAGRALDDDAGRAPVAPAAAAPDAQTGPAPLLDRGGHELAQAAAAARAALGELAALARDAPSLAPGAGELAAHLAGVEVWVGEAPGRGRVTVCDPFALRARRVRALILAGLQEGTFPRPATPEPFLSDRERQELARASGIRLERHEDALAVERYLFYATVSRPQERLILSTRTADDDGDPVVSSFFLDDVRAVVGPLAPVARPLGAVAWAGAPPTAREAARVAAAGAPPRVPAPIAALRGEPVLRALRERPAWSPSALESWAGCPVKWFVERYLLLDDLGPDPEPLRRGSVAHDTLEATLRELREQTGSAKVRPQTLQQARGLMRAALAQAAARTPISVNPERLAAGTRRLEADLDRYLQASAHDGSAFEPRHLEVAFGFQAGDEPADRPAEVEPDGLALPPLELATPDGPLRLRGRIDRVDVDPSGRRVQIVDYKTGSAPPGARWIQDRAFQAALYLRAASDLLGLEPAGAFYQPLSGPDARRRGLIGEDDDPGLDVVGPDRRPDDEVRQTLDAVVDLAVAAAAQARAGALEARPQTCTPRGACAYPGLCRCEAP